MGMLAETVDHVIGVTRIAIGTPRRSSRPAPARLGWRRVRGGRVGVSAVAAVRRASRRGAAGVGD